jgi:hypothetical protein
MVMASVLKCFGVRTVSMQPKDVMGTREGRQAQALFARTSSSTLCHFSFQTTSPISSGIAMLALLDCEANAERVNEFETGSVRV